MAVFVWRCFFFKQGVILGWKQAKAEEILVLPYLVLCILGLE